MNKVEKTTSDQAITPDPGFGREVEENSRTRVSACFQCLKCTGGCPVTFAMDLMPNQVIRMIQLGMKDEVLRSSTIWVCASCETCTTRCPNDIDIAHVMDTLRQAALTEKIAPAQKEILAFHQIFLMTIRFLGRLYEPGMLGALKAWTRVLNRGEIKLGWKMFRKGKLKVIPRAAGKGSELRAIFAKAKQKVKGEGSKVKG
ncbi:MAG: 4Fe-4S dicluster domain-containing protein [Proteobacteria bacterium]|nr:4Fe-4S dicluster domain-containing protein [Pseudomonadota bacterium]